MEDNKQKIYEEIKEILEKNKDAEKGFSKAAENARDIRLKNYFLQRSKDRMMFNQKLFAEIRIGYPKMDIEGSFAGTIHRVWMDAKALFAMDDDESMLEEAIRGDNAAIKEYNEVLDYKELPVGIRHLLNEQRDTIQTGVRNNSKMEDLN